MTYSLNERLKLLISHLTTGFLIVTNSKSPRNQAINVIYKKYLCTFEL
jgi:hypothetical protein